MSRVQIPSVAPFSLRLLAPRCATVRDPREVGRARPVPGFRAESAGTRRVVAGGVIDGWLKGPANWPERGVTPETRWRPQVRVLNLREIPASRSRLGRIVAMPDLGE